MNSYTRYVPRRLKYIIVSGKLFFQRILDLLILLCHMTISYYGVLDQKNLESCFRPPKEGPRVVWGMDRADSWRAIRGWGLSN